MVKKAHPKRMSWIAQRLSKGMGLLVLFFVIIVVIRHKQTSKTRKPLLITIEQNETNNEFVTKKDVLKTITEKMGGAIEGKAIGEIKVGLLEAALTDNPYVKRAQVYIDALNTVNVRIEQRIPIMRVKDINDETSGYYLDSDGFRVMASGLSSRQYPARVLVVTGAIGPYSENYKNSNLGKVFHLVKFIKKDPFLDAQIEQIHMTDSQSVVLIPKLGDHSIHFGSPDSHTADKFERLKIFYKECLSRKGWRKYKSMSLVYEGQIVARMNK